MGGFKGPKIYKLPSGLGRRNPSDDNVGALVMGGVAVVDKIALNEIHELIQVSDAEDLGLNAAYDANNGVLVYEHIFEFFRLNPDGKLYIMLVAQKTDLAGTSLEDMCDKAFANGVYKMCTDELTRGKIRYVGVVLNPDMASYVSTLSGGLDEDVFNAIPKAQELLDDLRTQHIYVDSIVIEGREANGTVAAMTDLKTLASNGVSVVIAQDPVIAALDADFADYAAVGSALGMLGIRKVSESLGSVAIANMPDAKKGNESYPLTDAASGRWLSASLSSGVKFYLVTDTERQALDDKGYIYVGKYEGYDGFYFNLGYTCTEEADDYSRIEKNRVWNKAVRLLRSALIPRMKAEVSIDPNTGYLKASTVASWEAAADKKVRQMIADGEASGRTVYIDPKQNINGGAALKVKLTIVPNGIAEEIEGYVGFENPFNS